MKYKVKITKQPKYQKGGRTLGDFSNMTEDQLENGPVYGFRPEPDSVPVQRVAPMESIPVQQTMQNIPSVAIPVTSNMVGTPVSIPQLRKRPQYTGVSIVDYLGSLGLPTSKEFRTKLAKNYGIANYTGTASQNTKLIDIINNSDDVLIDLGGKAPVVKRAIPRKWTPSPYTPHDIQWPSVPSEIQQREYITNEDLKNIVGVELGALLPEVSYTRTYPLPRGIAAPKPIQIPGPRNLPGKPFTGWTTGSGHIYPFQEGGEQDAQVQQVIQAVSQMLQQGASPDQVMQQLAQKGVPKKMTQQVIEMVMQKMQGGAQGPQEEMMEGPEGQNPQEEQMEPQMAYGGQMGYGLDLGARRLWMNQDSDESSEVTDSLEEVPREEANIEAEGGETALIPYEQNGGYLHKKIKGNRHTEGGVPLNVPEGTFIYSDTKKMKLGGPVLAMFGKSEKSTKKFTPADLAKQYNIDKYKAIMDDPKSDAIKKRTAELMVQNFEKKLAQLALVQEGKKGFPQGIPEVAKGYYQQMVAASNPKDSDIEGVQEDRAELQEEGTPEAMYGMGFRYGGGLRRFQGDVFGSEYNSDKENNIYNENEDLGTSYFPSNNGDYNYDPNSTNSTNSIDTNNSSDQYPKYGYGQPFVSYSEPTIPYDQKQKETKINNKEETTNKPTTEFQTYSNNLRAPWSTADKMNLANSLYNMATVKKATPFEPTVKLDRPETYYVDPSRALAANAEQMNAARQAASMFAGPQSRYSFNAGQYGKNAADIIGQYAMQNVGVANTAAQQNAAINNQQMQYDAQRVKRLYDAGVLSEQQYQNAMRQARAAALQAYTQGKTNAVNTANLSATQSAFYGLTPDQLVYFKYPGAQKDMFNTNRNQENDSYFTLINKLMAPPYSLSAKDAAAEASRRYGKQPQSATG